MRRIVCSLAGVLLAVSVLGSDSPKEYGDEATLDEIEGTWQWTESHNLLGRSRPSHYSEMTFRGGTFALTVPEWHGRYRIDPGHNPRHIDWMPENRAFQGQALKYIYTPAGRKPPIFLADGQRQAPTVWDQGRPSKVDPIYQGQADWTSFLGRSSIVSFADLLKRIDGAAVAVASVIEVSPRTKTARQGLRALRPTRPAGPEHHLAEPPDDGTTRDDHLDFAPWHAPQVSPGGFWQGKVLAGRKPLLLFRFAGALLLRLAERTFDA